MKDTKRPTPQKPRKPYEPPAIEEEDVFERDALIASCSQPGDCHTPIKSPS